MSRPLLRGSSVLIAARLHRGSSISSTTGFSRPLQRGSSISIVTALRGLLHRGSSISIATTLHRGSSISITTSLGGLVHARDFSANRDKDEAACGASAAQSCTLRCGLNSKLEAPRLPRWLSAVRNRQARSLSPDLSAEMLAELRSRRCDEDSSLAIEESSSGSRTSQVCANGIADPEPVPA